MPKILVSDSISDAAIELLEASGVDFTYEPEIAADELAGKISDYDGLIVRSRTKVTKEIIERADKLRVVGRAGVGLDNIDVESARQKGIQVLNTANALTNAVAEFTIAIMLVLSRKITLADSSMRQGRWIKNELFGSELKGKTYGTIGIGRIGARVAELAFAFGMKTMANDVIPVPESLIEKLGVKVSTQEEIFATADYVDLHVPLTKETTYLVNYDKLSLMKKNAYLINTSRGKVLNEKDLIRALDEGKLAGAALDVFETEPLSRVELQRSEKVVLTPHIAGQTDEAQNESGRQIVEEVLRIIK